MDREVFRNPGKEFRGAPFWSLNDRLEDHELVRQIGLMDEGWFGGFFLHAREGLTTPYMGEEWFSRLETCIREAEKRGMYAWLYDEDKWPSGFAGGVVPASSPEYRVKALAMMISGKIIGSPELLRVFECDFEDGNPVNLRIVKTGEKPKPGKNYIHFYVWTAPIGSKWFDGFTYLDALNPEAVRRFIESTYEEYRRRFGEWFGKTVPGIFTDEPNYMSGHAGGLDYPCIPWTMELPKVFKQRRGYDLLDHLPSLFFRVGDYRKVRYDFWRTVTELFLESYTRQLYEWCDRYGLKYTGHYLAEETLTSQIAVIGAAMPHYEYMHIPGIDHLCRHIEGFLTVKQVSSVANQLGKERVLSETYGCSGQNLSFEDRKWIGDWEYVLGVNFLNHHLSLYTMRGRRKRDYPPDLFYQQPWWRLNHLIESYFTRLSYALSRGIRVVDVLVIHPIGSGWAVYSPIDTSETDRLHGMFENLCRTLLERHWDFELGDEMIMARHGKVEEGCLVVGRCRYKAVIIPPSLTISSSVLRLLEEYVAEGGLLIAVKPTFTTVDCRPSDRVEKLLEKAVTVETPDEVVDILEKRVERRVLFKRLDGDDRYVWYHLRRDGAQRILFIANTGRRRGVELEVGLLGRGRLEEWDPFTGDVETVNQRHVEGYTYTRVKLPPVGSKLLVLDENLEPETVEFREPKTLWEKPIDGAWSLKRERPNALTLDYCKVEVDGSWSGRVPVWRAQDTVERLGYGKRFKVRYEFEVALEKLDREVWLVLESPEKFKVRVNGVEVEYKPEYGWWVDTSFKKIPLNGLLKPGLNTVELEGVRLFSKNMVSGVDAHELETEVEAVYIVGDFAVENVDDREFRIVEEKHVYEGGDLVKQGYPFYPGEVTLGNRFMLDKIDGRIFMVFEGLNAIAVEVSVNGRLVGYVFKRPHELDVTDYVKPGWNRVEVRLVNSLRNLLGPHHHKAGELTAVWPGSFRDELNWTDRYNFVPYGFDRVKLQARA